MKPRMLPWSAFPRVVKNGIYHCRWCKKPIGKKVKTFCSPACRDEVYVRTYTGVLRHKVYERDRGVCALCGLDCSGIHAKIRALRPLVAGRPKPAEAAAFNLKIEKARALFEKRRRHYLYKVLKFPRCEHRKTFWDCDHVTAVKDGGGGCSVANCRTLCLRCHKHRTTEQRKRVGAPDGKS